MRTRQPTTGCLSWVAPLFLSVVVLPGCGCGPASLDRLVPSADAEGYGRQLDLHEGRADEAWLAWRSRQTGSGVEVLREADAALSRSENPFSPDDLRAVRLGALVYRTSCIECHGRSADGRDAAGRRLIGHKDFTHPHVRLALKMNPDHLTEWFDKVERGMVSEHTDAQGRRAVIPAMGERLTREQIWLALTWLASDCKLAARVER